MVARWVIAVGVALVVVATLAGCRATVHVTLVVSVANDQPVEGTLRWAIAGSSNEQSDRIPACGIRADGLGPGTYTVTIDVGSSHHQTTLTAPAEGQLQVGFEVMGDGSIVSAPPGQTSARPSCVPPSG